MIPLPQDSDTVDLAIYISNFHYNVGGLINPIYIGTLSSLQMKRDGKFVLDGILVGVLLILAIYHAVLYYFRREDRFTLYFCICCLIFALRVITTCHYLENLFPSPAAFSVSSKIEYLVFYLGLPTFLSFVLDLYPRKTGQRLLSVFWLVGIVFSILVLVLPVPVYMAWTTTPYQIITLAEGIYCMALLVQAALSKQTGALVSLSGFIILFLFVIHDILYANLLINSIYLMPLGLACFTVAHSIVIAIRFSDVYRREKLLLQELHTEKTMLDTKVAEQTEKLQRAIQKLEESDRSKSRMLAMLSHELRTPITLLIVPVEQVIKGTYGTAIKNDSEFFQGLKRNTYRLLHIVEGLFNYAKIELGKYNTNRQAMELGAMLKFYTSEVESMTARKGLSLHFHSSVDYPLVIKADKYLFETAFFNLVSNAVKYTAPGGRIDILLALSPHMAKEQHSSPCAEIRVKDSGVGIEPDLLPSIFDKLYQSESGGDGFSDGAGIGLSLTKKIVELHGGSIRVESAPGKGSCFIITLPIIDEKLPVEDMQGQALLNLKASQILRETEEGHEVPDSVMTAQANTADYKPAVLIVEDNSELRRFLKTELSTAFHIVEAADGKQALDVLQSNTVIDLVVSDIMMPKMDGFAFLRKCQTLPERINLPFLFLTAKAETETRIEALREGACDYVEKPFNMEELMSRIHNLLKSHACIKKEALKTLREDLLHFLEFPPTQNSILVEPNNNQKTKLLDLTSRETLIVQGVLDGLTDKEIAFKLECATRTVSNSLTRIYRKYGVAGRTELIRFMLSQNRQPE